MGSTNSNLTYKEALESVEIYETKLRKLTPLDTEPAIEFNTTSIESFLLDFFSKNYFGIGTQKFSGTKPVGDQYRRDYNDKHHSYRGARRSLSDLYRLSLTYIGSQVKLIEVMDALYNISNNNLLILGNSSEKYELYNGICSTVYRRVFNVCNTSSNRKSRLNTSNENYYDVYGTDEDPISIRTYDLVCGTEGKKKREADSKKIEEVVVAKKIVDNSDIDKRVAEKIAQILAASNKESISLIRGKSTRKQLA